MAVRSSPALVEGVMNFSPEVTNIDPFIDAANELVTEICVPAGYTAERLKMIETWLAAHFLAIRDPRQVSESIGAASASYQTGQMGMNLSQTTYGQQAMLLDTKGGLAWLDKHISQGKRATVQVTWLGTPRRNWDQRTWLYSVL